MKENQSTPLQRMAAEILFETPDDMNRALPVLLEHDFEVRFLDGRFDPAGTPTDGCWPGSSPGSTAMRSSGSWTNLSGRSAVRLTRLPSRTIRRRTGGMDCWETPSSMFVRSRGRNDPANQTLPYRPVAACHRENRRRTPIIRRRTEMYFDTKAYADAISQLAELESIRPRIV